MAESTDGSWRVGEGVDDERSSCERIPCSIYRNQSFFKNSKYKYDLPSVSFLFFLQESIARRSRLLLGLYSAANSRPPPAVYGLWDCTIPLKYPYLLVF